MKTREETGAQNVTPQLGLGCSFENFARGLGQSRPKQHGTSYSIWCNYYIYAGSGWENSGKELISISHIELVK